MVTEAFADVLDNLRSEEGDDLDVDVLVDCLQSGLELMTQQDKELLLMSRQNSGEEWAEGDDGEGMDIAQDEPGASPKPGPGRGLTPHEKRRRELGFHVEAAGTP